VEHANLAPLPPRHRPRHRGRSADAGLTAWQALFDRSPAGWPNVLIHGAGGSVGSVAVHWPGDRSPHHRTAASPTATWPPPWAPTNFSPGHDRLRTPARSTGSSTSSAATSANRRPPATPRGTLVTVADPPTVHLRRQGNLLRSRTQSRQSLSWPPGLLFGRPDSHPFIKTVRDLDAAPPLSQNDARQDHHQCEMTQPPSTSSPNSQPRAGPDRTVRDPGHRLAVLVRQGRRTGTPAPDKPHRTTSPLSGTIAKHVSTPIKTYYGPPRVLATLCPASPPESPR